MEENNENVVEETTQDVVEKTTENVDQPVKEEKQETPRNEDGDFKIDCYRWSTRPKLPDEKNWRSPLVQD